VRTGIPSRLHKSPQRGTSNPERTARRRAVTAVLFQSALYVVTGYGHGRRTNDIAIGYRCDRRCMHASELRTNVPQILPRAVRGIAPINRRARYQVLKRNWPMWPEAVIAV